MARGSKFRIKKVEGLYYLCSENKGTDQLHSYFAADLHLCFLHMQKAGFLMMRLNFLFQHTDSAMSMHEPLQRPITPGQRKAVELAMGSQFLG